MNYQQLEGLIGRFVYFGEHRLAGAPGFAESLKALQPIQQETIIKCCYAFASQEAKNSFLLLDSWYLKQVFFPKLKALAVSLQVNIPDKLAGLALLFSAVKIGSYFATKSSENT